MTTRNNVTQGKLAKYTLGERIIDDIFGQYDVDYFAHYDLLANLAHASVERTPIVYIRNIPFVEATSGTSYNLSAASAARFKQIDAQLTALSHADATGAPPVEAGAINTARSVVKLLASRELAPPEVARLSDEAVVMLWALGKTRFALTITDGEAGYVVRDGRETIKRKTNIPVHGYDLLRLR